MPPDESNNKITTKSNNEVLDPSTSKGHHVVIKNVEDKLVEDVYSHGCKNAINPYMSKIEENLEKHARYGEIRFYDRLSDKDSILMRLNHGIDNIPKKFESIILWLNNLVGVKNDMMDKIHHHNTEVRFWWDIWTEELSTSMSKFANKQDVDDDIWDMRHDLQDYNTETYEHLNKEVKSTLDQYLPNDRTFAISIAKKIDKDTLMCDIESLLCYIEFCLQNVFYYCVQYAISLSKNIKKQLLEDLQFPIVESLKVPIPEKFETDSMNLDSVICKGCPNNKKRFNQRTILKHLKHSANNSCLELYSNDEISEMENISKLRQRDDIINWKNEQDPVIVKRYFKRKKLNKMLYKAISNLHSWKRETGRKLYRVQELFEEICWHVKEDRRVQMEIDIEKLEYIASHFSNYEDVKENILEWKEVIESEILESFEHLKTEIRRKYDYYFKIKNFAPRLLAKGESKSSQSFEWDAVELLHYIEFMHENSYAMIHEQTNLIAKHIKSQMNDLTKFPYEVIKKVHLPSDFKNLSNYLGFGVEDVPNLSKTLKSCFKYLENQKEIKRLTYGFEDYPDLCQMCLSDFTPKNNKDIKIPSYDLSEGISICKVIIHPEDHPNYPHVCYPAQQIVYQTWLKETSVHNPESCVEIIPLGEPEVCKCKQKENCKGWIPFFYETKFSAIKCEFSEENPICPFRPKCLGCNYMFYPLHLEIHLKEKAKCFGAYLPAEYNQVLHAGSPCYEDDCEFSPINPICPKYKTCQGCKYMFEFDEMEKHLKDHSICYDAFSPDDFYKLVESCNQIKAKKDKEKQKKDYFRYKKDMDEWKQIFKTHNITEDDLPPHELKDFKCVEKNWFSVYHLSNTFDKDYIVEDIDRTERAMDYRAEHKYDVSESDDDTHHGKCEDMNQTSSDMEDKNESSSTDDDASTVDDTSSINTSTDDDTLLQCKFCDEDFPTTIDKEVHEKKFHPTFHPDKKKILESND